MTVEAEQTERSAPFPCFVVQFRAELTTWSNRSHAMNVVVHPAVTQNRCLVELDAETATVATALYLAERAVISTAEANLGWTLVIVRAVVHPLLQRA
ncbi:MULTISPECIES: hypothetical protein [Micromonospora]|uniref:hypothetical protein n=1 Tax=Micromonospora TaxID=1873 RepID=UPI00340E8ACE